MSRLFLHKIQKYATLPLSFLPVGEGEGKGDDLRFMPKLAAEFFAKFFHDMSDAKNEHGIKSRKVRSPEAVEVDEGPLLKPRFFYFVSRPPDEQGIDLETMRLSPGLRKSDYNASVARPQVRNFLAGSNLSKS